MSIVKEFVNGFTSKSTDKDIKELEVKVKSWIQEQNCVTEKDTTYTLFGSKTKYSDFTPNNICLFVHLYKPIRKLGTILKAPKSIKISTMPEQLQYCILPIAFDETEPNKMNIHDRKPINIITKKRGLWLIVKGFENLEEKGTKEIYDIYSKYVQGMQYNPKNCEYKTFPQYNLDYPTKLPWEQGEKILYKRKHTKPLKLNKDTTKPPKKRRRKPKKEFDDDLLASSSDNEGSDNSTKLIKKKKKQRLLYSIPDSLKILPLIRSTEGLLEENRNSSSDNFDMTDEFYRDGDGKVTNKDIYDIDEENEVFGF